MGLALSIALDKAEEYRRLPDRWPARPAVFPDLMTPVEAAQYLRLDEFGDHTPASAMRTLDYFRDKGELMVTRYARRKWYRKLELDEFLKRKTEKGPGRN